VLINEAGAAAVAKPFLDRLHAANIEYECEMPFARGDTRRDTHPVYYSTGRHHLCLLFTSGVRSFFP